MRLLMLNYEFPPLGGGGGQAHRCLLERFAQVPELEVDVLTSASVPGVTTEALGTTITVTRIGVHKKDLHLWRRREVLEWLGRARSHSRQMVRSTPYDLVHAFFAFPTGWLCWRDPGARPYLLSLRGSDVPGRNTRLKLDYALLSRLVFRPIWRGAAALVACSEGLRRRALQLEPSADVLVIPNGVDLDRFRPAKPMPEDRGPLQLLTVGRLSAGKRIDLLIDAVERLHATGCPAQLTVVGGGALDALLHEAVHRRGLEGSITLSGRVPASEMPGIYRRADLYVSASVEEGMSNAMLEAAASGLPMATTRCEGVDELAADNAVVVESATAEGLAAAIHHLVADPTRRAGMARAARELAGRFTWESAAEQYLAMYERFVGKRTTLGKP